MKRLMALIISTALIMSVLVGCGTAAPASTSNTAPANEAATEEKEETAATETADAGNAEDTTLLVFTGVNVGDFRIIDSAYSGVQDTCEKYGYNYNLIELGGDFSIAESSLDDACSSGKYQYVITGYQGMKDVYEAMAQKYPEITFIMYDVPTTYEIPSDNMIAISFKQFDGSYLAGVYSALMSKTKKVAVGLWDDNPILNDFGTGYVNGVKDANDMFDLGVEYKVVYFGGDSTDATGAYELANTVFNDGYDVFYNVAGHVVLSATKACEEHGGYEEGYYVIGVDTDQWTKYDNSPDVDAVGYENIATSIIKDAQNTIVYVFDGLQDGSIKQGDLVVTGLVEGGVRMAENDNYNKLTPEEIRKTMEEITQKITSGEKEVLSYFDFETYDDFATYRDDPDSRVEKP